MTFEECRIGITVKCGNHIYKITKINHRDGSVNLVRISDSWHISGISPHVLYETSEMKGLFYRTHME